MSDGAPRFELALFGNPVDHSLSPVIHQAALAALGLAGSYRAFPVDEEGFRLGCADLRNGRLHGANVTMPHKRRAADEVDDRSPGADRADSVNTIVVEGSHLIGHSTDIDGIREVWSRVGLSRQAPLLVLGAGGAAAASLIALDSHELMISARRDAAAERLAAWIDLPVRRVPWGTPVPGAVIVNATPLGMNGENLPEGLIEQSSGLLDMAYGPAPTPAARAARRAGLPTAEGTELLLAQGTVSFELWTGRPAPRDAMRAALQKAQATR